MVISAATASVVAAVAVFGSARVGEAHPNYKAARTLGRRMAEAGFAVLPTTRADRIRALDSLVRFWESEWPQLERRFEEFVREDQQ